uniref:Uncharacterized protein n=1 Tax=Noctiluca scintillans TaxID=2966 RepID=A0A7S1A344_NOCSC|mmetsp:Transcript_29878/g.79509  ORF Transcript_29878/g.79509 Transcript_29878/m.79509 type:complete len:241 (+) Transcript_29878:114-836(+)|eukprot:CAMPEP_0194487736 /NCGR_PEP_ID=MMETSP0253-20130528/7920_1 /TAXON_ID=2966 /ORGANISM="Noctiluca scintillans" /LENGTH=240 /DNA_ID=CAMNT_0039327999 /DNA_START=102 /DNA_END=824 /DNA_ORIENTATION=-
MNSQSFATGESSDDSTFQKHYPVKNAQQTFIYTSIDSTSAGSSTESASEADILKVSSEELDCRTLCDSREQSQSQNRAFALLEHYGVLGAPAGAWSSHNHGLEHAKKRVQLRDADFRCARGVTTDAEEESAPVPGERRWAAALFEHYGLLDAPHGAWTASTAQRHVEGDEVFREAGHVADDEAEDVGMDVIPHAVQEKGVAGANSWISTLWRLTAVATTRLTFQDAADDVCSCVSDSEDS